MLREIGLRNFKCFKEMTRIPVANFNLLTGVNGRGKSSALQALLLMRQSVEHSRTTDRLIFNGSCIDLGNFNDVRNSNISQKEAIEIKFDFDDEISLHYFLLENEIDELSVQINKVRIRGVVEGQEKSLETEFYNGKHTIQSIPVYWQDLILHSSEIGTDLFPVVSDKANFARIHYISADRIGPRDFYPKQSFAEFPNVGRRGEYTPHLLYQMKDKPVNEMMVIDHEKKLVHTLLDQTQAWLSIIFDGARIDPIPTDANIVLLTLRSDETPIKGYKPINVGFGYSYALPIIVSGLIAQPGQILIIENPEAHLHPYAQSQITKFLTLVSTTGVQVFVETHSDHVLNAVRLSVLDKILASQDTNVLFFKSGETPEVIKIPVNDEGRIEQWPEGFFDQLDKDFARLFG
jgi:predicted ATPase